MNKSVQGKIKYSESAFNFVHSMSRPSSEE